MATMEGVYTRKVAIDGGTQSNWVASCGGALVGAIVPSGMSGTSLKVEMSNDEGVTNYPCNDSTGTQLAATINSSASYTLFPQYNLCLGADLVRVVSSATESSKYLILVFQKVA